MSFLRSLTSTSMRVLPTRMPIRAAPLASRFYSTQGNRNAAPKFRYLVFIVALSSVGFYYSATNLVDKKAPQAYTEADYEAHKKKMRVLHKKSAFRSDEAQVVFVLGGPGSGKGTQCEKLVREYDFVHLSAGDLLRDEQKREGSEYGSLIADYIRNGEIVPQEITIALLRRAMKDEIVRRLDDKEHDHQFGGPCKFLIDGFPRKMDQALKFEEDVAPCRFVLFFECPEEIMLKRLLKRGESSGRTDDNIESIKKRFKVFEDTSMPVVNYFDKAGKVVNISCDQPEDVIFKQIQMVLESKV